MTLGVGAQGLMTSSKCKQNVHKHTPIMSTSIKKRHPKLIYFLLQTTRLSPSLEGLNSSLAQSAAELWPLAKMAKVTFCGSQIFTHFCFLSHNLYSRYARKPIKGSKDSDYSLVSNKAFAKKWHVGLASRTR